MSRHKKLWRYLRFAFLTVGLLAAGFTLYLDFRVRSEFEGRRFALPARIYARPLELHAGLRIAQADIVDELREAGYREVPREGEPGWFVRNPDGLEIAVRPFVFWDGPQPAKRIRVAFDGGTVAAVRDAEGKGLPLARLEPLSIGGIYPANNEDRVLVRLAEVPKHLVQALVATEDHNFYARHERGGNRQTGPTATAPHLDSTDSAVERRLSATCLYRRSWPVSDRCSEVAKRPRPCENVKSA